VPTIGLLFQADYANADSDDIHGELKEDEYSHGQGPVATTTPEPTDPPEPFDNRKCPYSQTSNNMTESCVIETQVYTFKPSFTYIRNVVGMHTNCHRYSCLSLSTITYVIYYAECSQ
jgi:hypothetical protein